MWAKARSSQPPHSFSTILLSNTSVAPLSTAWLALLKNAYWLKFRRSLAIVEQPISASDAQATVEILNEADLNENKPFVKLDRIVIGRCLFWFDEEEMA